MPASSGLELDAPWEQPAGCCLVMELHLTPALGEGALLSPAPTSVAFRPNPGGGMSQVGLGSLHWNPSLWSEYLAFSCLSPQEPSICQQ